MNSPDALPVDVRRRRTHKALRRTMVTLLERKPLSQITIRDIAAEAEIGYATFPMYYPSKAELVRGIAGERVGELLEEALPLLVSGNARSACLAICKYVAHHGGMWSALLTGGAADMVREEFFRQSAQRGMAKMPRSTWVPSDLRFWIAWSSPFSRAWSSRDPGAGN